MAKIEPTVAGAPAPQEGIVIAPQANPGNLSVVSVPSAPTPFASAPAVTVPPATQAVPAHEPRQLDQLSRIEEKAARIEEKFARYEAVLTRAEAALERSAHKVDAAAGTMDFAAIRGEISALRDRVDATPRAATLFMTAIVTAVLTVILTILVLKFGVPGVMPKLLP
jgi:hypothetical protein